MVLTRGAGVHEAPEEPDDAGGAGALPEDDVGVEHGHENRGLPGSYRISESAFRVSAGCGSGLPDEMI